MTNFVVWDIESSGLSTKYDQMITFAAVLTDDNFNILEEFSLKGTPNKGVLPAFGALSTNGIKMTEIQKGNLSQYQMVLQIWKKFSEWSNIKPITFISQNGFRFDEEMLRHSFYMNLLPVFMTNTGGNCRCDSLHIFKSTAIFRPTFTWKLLIVLIVSETIIASKFFSFFYISNCCNPDFETFAIIITIVVTTMIN